MSRQVSEPITREALSDGLLQAARHHAPSDLTVWSEAQLAASLASSLGARPADVDVWVFGYGSLMWNPCLSFDEARPVTVRGWQRRFCLSSTGRGSPERPGIMLALASGGTCPGLAYRLPRDGLEEELLLLWRREMLYGAYLPRWLDAESAAGPLTVLAFVANEDHPRFLPEISEDDVARRIAFARGPLGSCLAYFRETLACLAAMGARDPFLERTREAVDGALADGPPPGVGPVGRRTDRERC